MKRIAINGTFLSEKRTGIYRFAEEIIKALDNQVANSDVRLVVPRHVPIPFVLNNIKVVEFGYGKGIPWEQTFFALYLWLHCATALNLSNVTPLLAPRGFSVIHDISYKVNPQYFSHLYGRFSRLWHCLNYWVIARFARHIFTVSIFSKNEIVKVYRVSAKKISVAYNAWQHMLQIRPSDETTLNKFDLKRKEYFLSLSTIAPNKNLKWILETAKNNPEDYFAIAGSLNPNRFGVDLDLSSLANVKFLGYVDDSDFVMLAKNCKAFLFPSFYEGFGIPPLEAMSVGAPVVVSNIEVLKEIFQDSAHYIDPNGACICLSALLNERIDYSDVVLNKFSWRQSAQVIEKCIDF